MGGQSGHGVMLLDSATLAQILPVLLLTGHSVPAFAVGTGCRRAPLRLIALAVNTRAQSTFADI